MQIEQQHEHTNKNKQEKNSNDYNYNFTHASIVYGIDVSERNSKLLSSNMEFGYCILNGDGLHSKVDWKFYHTNCIWNTLQLQLQAAAAAAATVLCAYI